MSPDNARGFTNPDWQYTSPGLSFRQIAEWDVTVSQESKWKRSPQLLAPNLSTLVVVDVQERLLPTIPQRDILVKNVRFLMDVAAMFQVMVIVTEQYPKGLGQTVPKIAGHNVVRAKFEKLRFSAAEEIQNSRIIPAGGTSPAPQVVLVGTETHICVQQTALDLLSQGYAVFLAADAVGSRHSADHVTALQRMQASGVTITTVEAIAFEWCETASSEQFRTLSRLVKERDIA
jgi:nicotinamidase-related amidase